MMKQYALPFYSGAAWQSTRRAYAKSKGGLCERCLEKGIIKPGEVVHHKVHISPANIDDPEITLSWDNLQLLCRECHADIHTRKKRRWRVDETGRVTAR